METISKAKIGRADALRLILEALETLGDEALKMGRLEQIQLLRRVMQKGIAAVQDEEATVTLEEAAWASVEERRGLRPTTKRDLRHFVRRILRVEGAAEMPLRGMTAKDCRRILATAFGASASSYTKGRAILSSVFSFGIRQEWCANNPVSRITPPKIEEKPIEPLCMEEIERLLRTAQKPRHRCMDFSLRLMLYCGIRPMEVKRLKDNDIHREEKIVIIRPGKSKTGGGRAVTLRGLSGLTQQDCHIPRNWDRRWRALRQDAGFTRWTSDVCRHTFASYHAAQFRNLPELQLEMGHRDSSLLRSRYMMPVSRKEATLFWAVSKGAQRTRKGNSQKAGKL